MLGCVAVTGAAGYIASHTVLALVDARAASRILLIDNLSRGSQKTLRRLGAAVAAAQSGKSENSGESESSDNLVYGHECELVECVQDCGDVDAMTRLLREHSVSTLFHFASPCYVGESVRNPRFYYEAVTHTSTNVMAAAQAAGCVRTLVYSSTCATYGNPPDALDSPELFHDRYECERDVVGVDEHCRTKPESPYGRSKLMAEQILQDMNDAANAAGASSASRLNLVILRYFNVIGSDPQMRVGPRWPASCAQYGRVVDMLFSAVLGERTFRVFGDDFETRDGTAIRDYVHVSDLASAHVAAATALTTSGNPSENGNGNTEIAAPERGVARVYNVGTSRGYSVLELLRAAERASGCTIPHSVESRRDGDPERVVADAGRIKRECNWTSRHTLDDMLAHHWAWFRRERGVFHDDDEDGDMIQNAQADKAQTHASQIPYRRAAADSCD